MTIYKIFCADCKTEYTQKLKENNATPHYCGNCGSTWIAVKISKEYCPDCGARYTCISTNGCGTDLYSCGRHVMADNGEVIIPCQNK